MIRYALNMIAPNLSRNVIRTALLAILPLAAWAIELVSCARAQTPEERAAQHQAQFEQLLVRLPSGSSHFMDLTYVDGAKPRPDTDSKQTLDLFVPPGSGPFPLIIWIHGGGWQGGSNELSGIEFAGDFLPHGFALASLDYRFVQDASFPAPIEDCKSALLWLKKNAAQYHLDAGRVGVCGESAGAHLAALLAVTGDSAKFSSDPAADLRIQAAICWATPADLDRDRGHWPLQSVLYHPEDPLFKAFPHGIYDVALADRYSPASYVHTGVPPMIIVHGAKDELVPLGQAQTFAENLKKAGNDVTFRIDPEHGHGVLSAATKAEAVTFFERTLEQPVGQGR